MNKTLSYFLIASGFVFLMQSFWISVLFFLWGFNREGNIFEILGGLLGILVVIRIIQYWYQKDLNVF
jgi:hypothetical protein